MFDDEEKSYANSESRGGAKANSIENMNFKHAVVRTHFKRESQIPESEQCIFSHILRTINLGTFRAASCSTPRKKPLLA